MLGWIIRILFILAAPITALFVARDALNFGVIQTFVAMLLLVGVVGLGAVWSAGRSRVRP
jgi:hypothetical protein